MTVVQEDTMNLIVTCSNLSVFYVYFCIYCNYGFVLKVLPTGTVAYRSN